MKNKYFIWFAKEFKEYKSGVMIIALACDVDRARDCVHKLFTTSKNFHPPGLDELVDQPTNLIISDPDQHLQHQPLLFLISAELEYIKEYPKSGKWANEIKTRYSDQKMPGRYILMVECRDRQKNILAGLFT